MACVDYIEKSDVTRAVITEMLSTSLVVKLRKASMLDPESKIQIPREIVEAII